MKLYVWRGECVLKNYTSGLVVVAARNPDEAWRKLKQVDFNAWVRLTYDIGYVFSEDELEIIDLDTDVSDDWVAPQPEEFTLDTLPVLVKHGGE